ncbi:MAG: TIGR02594 family protein [Planctomycetes bacterium]|nr:TIGR02594 family protein [Planctomycetota bacterium]
MDVIEQLERRVTDTEALRVAIKEIRRLSAQKDTEPAKPWFNLACKYLGIREYKGSKHNPKILEWWVKIRAPFTSDETPWCAGFVGGVLEECGIVSTRKANARSYLKWGVELDLPVVGAIVVFWRGSKSSWKGHVGFVAGRDEQGRLLVVGGNQGDAVSLKAFNTNQVLGYRWPKSTPIPESKLLPVGTAAKIESVT